MPLLRSYFYRQDLHHQASQGDLKKDKRIIERKKGSSRSQMFHKIDFIKNFVIFTRKHLCWSLFLMKLQA